MPEEADVKITPPTAIAVESAKATNRKPAHCKKQAENTLTLRKKTLRNFFTLMKILCENC